MEKMILIPLEEYNKLIQDKEHTKIDVSFVEDIKKWAYECFQRDGGRFYGREIPSPQQITDEINKRYVIHIR